MADLAAALPGDNFPVAPDHRIRPLCGLALYRLFHTAVRYLRPLSLGPRVHGDPFPGGRVLVLLGDHRHRPRAAPTALPGPDRAVVRGDAVPRLLRDRADDDVVYGGRYVLSFRQSAVVVEHHRRPASRRWNCLEPNGIAGHHGHRGAGYPMGAPRPPSRVPRRPACRQRLRRRRAGSLQRDASRVVANAALNVQMILEAVGVSARARLHQDRGALARERSGEEVGQPEIPSTGCSRSPGSDPDLNPCQCGPSTENCCSAMLGMLLSAKIA